MNYQEFANELRRMAETNGVMFVNHDKLMNLLSYDIAHEADFINIIPSFSDKNQYFVVTSQSASAVKMGTFGAKLLWTIPIGDIRIAEPRQSYFNGYQIDELRIETSTGRREFRFGFNSPDNARRAAMAAGNTQTAVTELRVAMAPSAPPQQAVPDRDDYYLQVIAHLRNFVVAISAMTGPDTIGQPFGEGLGLEYAIERMFESFDHADTMRSASSMVAVSLLTDGSKAGIGRDDLTEVMGLSNLRQVATDTQVQAAEGLANAAIGFLGQFSEDGQSLWELWKSNDEVAGEFLCWHAIAWQRLASQGRVPLLQSFGR